MTDTATFRFVAPLLRWHGAAAWFFVALPPDLADEIAARFDTVAAGFGSIRVEVTLGSTTWATSLFPDSKRGTYVLPVKAAVRRAEDVDDEDDVAIALRVGDVPPAPVKRSRRAA